MRRISDISRLCIIALALLAASCSPAKHCARPDLNLPSVYLADMTDSTTIADIEWWTIYSDTVLHRLIQQTLEHNKDILIASERIEEMRQMHRISKSALFPSLSGEVGGNHEWTNAGGSKPVSDPEITARLDLSWEIDLWGNLRWASRKGAAEYLASVEAKRAMQMTLISEVAKAYFELIALDNEYTIVQRTLVTRQEGARQAKIRFEGGLTAETPYQQAQVELASTASIIPELKRNIAVKESQIALLTGQYPGEIKRGGQLSVYESRLEVPVGIPSGLLQRRPDIRQEEQKLAAAQAAVGVAQAERFPKFTINLAAGLENDAFTSFFKSPIYNMAAELVAPIFSFGRRKARFKASVSAYNQAKLSYEKKVLEAFKEVYDAVITYQTAQENVVLKRNLLNASRKNVELTRFQYIDGAINYLDLLDAQRKYFDAQIALSDAVRDEHLSFIALYKSLGGGW